MRRPRLCQLSLARCTRPAGLPQALLRRDSFGRLLVLHSGLASVTKLSGDNGLRRQAVTGDLLSRVTQKFGLVCQVNEHRLLHLVCGGDVLAQLWALGHTLALLSSLYPVGGLVARGTPLCWLSTCKACIQLLCDHSSAAARSLCTCWTQNFSGCSLFCASLNASIQWVLPCTL